jgi:hypothetical protein
MPCLFTQTDAIAMNLLIVMLKAGSLWLIYFFLVIITNLWKYHVCNVLSIRRLGYNCTVYLNRQLTDNVTSMWMRTVRQYDKNAAYKSVALKGCLVSSTGLPPEV